MAEQWELCIVYLKSDSVHYFNKDRGTRTKSMKVFIENEYPGYKWEKNSDYYKDLICFLLREGWEPFNYTIGESGQSGLCFRRKVNS